MELLFLLIGLAAGVVIGALVAGRKSGVLRAELKTCEKELEMVRAEILRQTEQQFRAAAEKQELWERSAEERIARERAVAEERVKEANRQAAERLAEQERLFSERLSEQREQLEARMAVQIRETEELQKRMSTEFENLSNRIFRSKTEDFAKLNAENVNALLRPLGENLKEFREKVEQVYDKESKQRFSLEERIKELVELNNRISEEANNLTRALRGDSKMQGNWGEMILERILQASGLMEGEHYFRQEFLRDEIGNPLLNEESGQKMQPDIIVRYPGGREMIIDSKVSLTAYTAYTATEDEEERSRQLKAHMQSVRSHIDELSRKDYSRYDVQAPEFVMMFIPTESAYLVAVKEDPCLWEYAYNKKVVLMSPTNLITALRLALDLWKREYQVKNVQAIVERGTSLYEKIVGFTDTFLRIGDALAGVQKEYEKGIGQLSTGRGNLVRQAEQLRGMSLSPKRRISSRLLQGQEQEEQGEEQEPEDSDL